MRVYVLLLCLMACEGSGGSKDRDRGITEISGSDWCAVQTLFRRDCNVCHSADTFAGGLDLETDAWTSLVGQPSATYSGTVLVVAGDAAGSLLYRKLTGTQDPIKEGSRMPPVGLVSTDDQERVLAWIEGGARADCDDDPDGFDEPPYHPDGWAESAVHGMAAKYQDQDCLSCHGEALDGGTSGVACDTCHSEGWRTDCTWCHGGEDDATGAPPVDIDGLSTDLAFAEHTAHVTETIHSAFDCVQCHGKPTDVLSTGHVFVGDVTPGIAEVAFGGGLSPAGAWNAGCSNLYCHGNGQSGSTGSASIGDTSSCAMCHADASDPGGLSGEHGKHVGEGYACDTCHAHASGSDAIADPAPHVDGDVDVTLPEGMAFSSGSCTGTCHGEDHSGRHWN